MTWNDNRYELGAFRFTDQQLLPLPGTHRERLMANPYWGASLSRRWQLFDSGTVKGFFGFGVAGRTESDVLSTTRWDFASQLGLRIRLPGNRVVAEVTMRHWSNGGLFGVDKAERIPVDALLNPDHTLATVTTGLEGLP